MGYVIGPFIHLWAICNTWHNARSSISIFANWEKIDLDGVDHTYSENGKEIEYLEYLVNRYELKREVKELLSFVCIIQLEGTKTI